MRPIREVIREGKIIKREIGVDQTVISLGKFLTNDFIYFLCLYIYIQMSNYLKVFGLCRYIDRESSSFSRNGRETFRTT